MVSVDVYYAKLLSPQLSLFKQKQRNVFNFRCPICGDSTKDRTKARGYLFPYKNHLQYKCHNCQTSLSFSSLLRDYFPEMYSEYSLELYKNSSVKYRSQETTEVKKSDSLQRFELPRNTQRIVDLETNHFARRYIEQRRIPRSEQVYIYYTDNFQMMLREYELPFDKVSNKPRIILPFFDRNWNLMGFQGRALPQNQNDIRYITIKLHESFPKLYGLHRLSEKPSRVFVTEGPLDSLFIEDSLAMMGSDIDHSTIVGLSNTENVVYVFDNEPRNRQIVDRMKKVIDNGHSLVIWNKETKKKDINDMVLSGMEVNDVMKLIDGCTKKGLEANLAMMEFSRV